MDATERILTTVFYNYGHAVSIITRYRESRFPSKLISFFQFKIHRATATQ